MKAHWGCCTSGVSSTPEKKLPASPQARFADWFFRPARGKNGAHPPDCVPQGSPDCLCSATGDSIRGARKAATPLTVQSTHPGTLRPLRRMAQAGKGADKDSTSGVAGRTSGCQKTKKHPAVFHGVSSSKKSPAIKTSDRPGVLGEFAIRSQDVL